MTTETKQDVVHIEEHTDDLPDCEYCDSPNRVGAEDLPNYLPDGLTDDLPNYEDPIDAEGSGIESTRTVVEVVYADVECSADLCDDELY